MKSNFRKITKVFVAVVIVAITISCNKEELSVEKSTIRFNRSISATATMPKNTDKAHLNVGTNRPYWDNGDAININGTTLTATNINDSAANFRGDVTSFNHAGKDCYWVVYPATIYASSSTSGLVVNLPSTQTFNSSSPLNGTTYMAAHTDVTSGSNDVNFAMKNLVSLLKLTLTSTNVSNKKLSKIVVYHSSQNLHGNFTITSELNYTGGTYGAITINCTDGTHNYIDITSATDVYIALPPLATGGIITMRMYNTDDQYTTKNLNMGSQPFDRNTVYNSTINNVAFEKIDGLFSVSSTKKVIFSPGNLQWSATNGGASATTHEVKGGGTAAGTWRFAENQWDTIATRNKNASSTYTGWINLFGWGTSGYNSKYPYMTSTTNSNYGNGSNDIASTNYDWGVYNAIYNPQTSSTDAPDTWRTLTSTEWEYILNTRSGNRYAKAIVNGIRGLIILPDNWSTSTYSLSNINTANSNYDGNTITLSNWTILENAGCIFLPAGGYRSGTTVSSATGTTPRGYYWSATRYNTSSSYSYCLRFDNGGSSFSAGVRPNYSSNSSTVRSRGFSVRLVKDAN